MIECFVDEKLRPTTTLNIKGTRVSFLIDTGFTGTMVIERSVATSLELEYAGASFLTLADGKKEPTLLYNLPCRWFEAEREFRAHVFEHGEGYDNLLGTKILRGCLLSLAFGAGQSCIAELPK